MIENLKDKRVILASQSPRRQKLLREIVPVFDTVSFRTIIEEFPDGLNKNEIPVYLSELKSDGYEDLITYNTILITSDTIVWKDKTVIGKPADKEEARRMIRGLSGNCHEVITGVTIRTFDKKISFHSNTLVYFDVISDEEIDFYIEKYNPIDKAGAYGIQEWIGYIGIERIEGSYFNVMGLPVHQVYKVLKEIN